jgi:predicted RNA-binding Zn-ribbon protein involved in translation (DUF1610 family)
MGPTKAVVKGGGLFEARSGKLIYRQVSTGPELSEYAGRHYVVLPELDKAGQPWELDGSPVYCLHGARYETLDDQPHQLFRCPDCGGMAVRMEELTVERDCRRCTKCGHEFEARLQMMES